MNEGKPTDRTAAIRTWLMKAPRPVALGVYGADGKESDVQLRQGEPWSAIAISVAALLPERIEALNADGKLLRACVVSDLVAKEEKDEAHKQSAFLALSTSDPETQRLIVVAELLQRSQSEALLTVRETTGEAFRQMQTIADSLAQSAQANQQAANDLAITLRNILIDNAQQVADLVESTAKTGAEEGPFEKLARNFAAGQAAAGAEQPPAEKPTNGKH